MNTTGQTRTSTTSCERCKGLSCPNCDPRQRPHNKALAHDLRRL